MKRTALPPRKKPIRRGGSLSQVSNKQRKAKARLRKAQQVVDATQDHWCIACGSSFQLERSHVLTQKQHEKHRANPLNMVYLCVQCHPIWEHNKPRFARLYPEAFARKVAIMQQLDPNYFVSFVGAHPGLFTSLPAEQ